MRDQQLSQARAMVRHHRAAITLCIRAGRKAQALDIPPHLNRALMAALEEIRFHRERRRVWLRFIESIDTQLDRRAA